MVALDQMDGGASTRNLSRAYWPVAEPALKETAAWIIGRHRDWAVALAGVLE